MIYDTIVIGAGPGGMNASLYLSRAGKKVLLIERGLYGGQLLETKDVENYLGFGEISGEKLAENMEKHAKNQENITHQYGNVTEIDKKDGNFVVKARKKEFLGKTVIIATGVKHKKLNIVGEDEYSGKGVSYCAVCDGSFFKGKHVVVVGGGDSAFEEGSYLAEIASRVTLVYYKNSNQIKAQKLLQERFRAKNNTSVQTGLASEEIVGEDGKVTGILLIDSFMNDGRYIEADGVFVYVGVEPNTEFLKNSKNLLKDGYILDEEGFIKTVIHDTSTMTVANGLFAVGDVVSGSIRQIATAVGDGALASADVLEYLNKNK